MSIIAIQNNDGSYSFKGRSLNITKEKNIALEPFSKQVWNYGLVLHLLPNEQNISDINNQIGNARFLANRYKDDRDNFYNENKSILNVSTYKKDYLPKLKEEYSFLKLSDKFALESALEHMDSAYVNFYNKLKENKTKVVSKGKRKGKLSCFPKFVSKYKPNGNSYTTKFTNNNIELLEKDNIPYVKLPKVGLVRIVVPLGKTLEDLIPINTRITSATIKRSSCNVTKNTVYTISLQLESIIDKITPITMIEKSSIWASDMGLKDFAIYGNTKETFKQENPHFIKTHEKRLRRLQKSLSRKQYNVETHKGSKNYYKAKDKISKEHRKIRNQRKDLHHKLSSKIVKECNVFICEDLNIQGMVKNKHLAKEISSVGWGQFLNFVKYKLERKGGYFLKVNRFFPSSKLCNECGYKNTNLTLKDRQWVCPNCGTIHDRDENAKNNLIEEGICVLLNNYQVSIV